ncbi:hypothetical protein SLE2022_201300 [Rubroshorea leprosula]
MNRASPEMLHCTDMTVLEQQRAQLKWQQEQFHHHHHHQQEEGYFSELSGVFSTQSSQGQGFQGEFMGGDSVLGEVVMTRQVKADPGLDDGWPDLGTIEMPDPGLAFGPPCAYGNGLNYEVKYTMSRTSGCPPSVAAAAAASAAAAAASAAEVKEKESVTPAKIPSASMRESFKKRKVEKLQNTKVVAEKESKRSKGYAEEGDRDSKITEQTTNKSSSSKNKREASAGTSKENSKVSDVQKPDYIHVRARRGQATDSHSLAERVRRERISERMRYLQDLVPGCNKITGKAGMLDEIINYVQSLQRQVEFLSMKLATVNPTLDFNVNNLIAKEVFPACTASFPAIGMSSEMTNPTYLQFNLAQQAVSCCGLDMGTISTDMGLRRTISAPVSVPEAFIDSSCIPVMQQIQPPAPWDADLQNLYTMAFDQGRSTPFPSQPFTGCIEPSNQKMES